MSIQYAEGDLYIGSTGGGAITAASGTSGVACGSVRARQVQVVMPPTPVFFRDGLKADAIRAYNRPNPSQTRIVLEPRDDSYADAMREILRQVFGSTTGGRSDFANGQIPGKLSSTVQLIVRPVTSSLDVCLYAPAAVFIGDIDLIWSRETTHTQQMLAEFRPTTIDATSSRAALMWSTTAAIQAAYF